MSELKIISFDECFDRLLGNEGGYVNNPDDPGGETNWGISKRSYPSLDIKSLTRDDAKVIYKRDFYDRVNAYRLPGSVVFQLFDFAVNSGCDTAIRYFQRSLGVADDGHFGPHSIDVANQTSENDMLLGINAERLDFMTRLSNWPNASRGWARRISNNLRQAKSDNQE